MLPKFSYVKAEGVAHALDLLARPESRARVLAGGTDLIVDMRERGQGPGMLVDISEVPELAMIRVEGGATRIGGCTTVSALAGDARVREEFPALVAAIDSFADFLTRNKATVGGNLANASPGADLIVPLLALEASVVLARVGGERTIPLGDFLRGPRSTALEPGELLTEVVIPLEAPPGQAYEKLGLKHGGAIAVVSCAVLLEAAGDRCTRARISLGAVAPTPFRSSAAEQVLEDQPYTPETAERAAALAAESATPITDVRGSAEYRRAMVRALVRRGLDAAWARAQAKR